MRGIRRQALEHYGKLGSAVAGESETPDATLSRLDLASYTPGRRFIAIEENAS